jgi:hypothetical protein
MTPTLVFNPYALLAIFGLLVASLGTVGYKGYRMGENACIAEHAKLLSVELRTRDAAMAAAAEAIQKIEVHNTTVRQKTETVTREVPVYRDCRHSADGLRLVNQALTNAEEPAAGSELPPADAADRR